MEAPDRTYNLGTALNAIRRRRALIAIVTVIVAAGGLAISLLQDDRYTAHASVLPQDLNFDQQAFRSKIVTFQDNALTTLAQAGLGSVDDVAARASEVLGGALSRSQISDDVDLHPNVDTNLLNIDATASSPELAARLANAYARSMIDVRREENAHTIAHARSSSQKTLRSLPADSESAHRLRAQLDDLRTFEDLQTGGLQQVGTAVVPETRSSPKPVLSTFAGGIAGLLIGISMALVLERTRPRLSSPADLERALGAPTLGTMEASGGGGRVEDLQMLRTRMLHGSDGSHPSSVLIVPLEDEPAGGLAVDISNAAAAGGMRTLRIEADLRTGEAPDGPGLAELLGAQAEASGVTHRGEAGATADRIAPGQRVADPAAILGRPSMRALIASESAEYELVVLVAPSPLLYPDAIPLLAAVDAIFVAVKPDAEEGRCEALRDRLADLGATPSGSILLGN